MQSEEKSGLESNATYSGLGTKTYRNEMSRGISKQPTNVSNAINGKVASLSDLAKNLENTLGTPETQARYAINKEKQVKCQILLDSIIEKKINTSLSPSETNLSKHETEPPKKRFLAARFYPNTIFPKNIAEQEPFKSQRLCSSNTNDKQHLKQINLNSEFSEALPEVKKDLSTSLTTTEPELFLKQNKQDVLSLEDPVVPTRNDSLATSQKSRRKQKFPQKSFNYVYDENSKSDISDTLSISTNASSIVLDGLNDQCENLITKQVIGQSSIKDDLYMKLRSSESSTSGKDSRMQKINIRDQNTDKVRVLNSFKNYSSPRNTGGTKPEYFQPFYNRGEHKNGNGSLAFNSSGSSTSQQTKRTICANNGLNAKMHEVTSPCPVKVSQQLTYNGERSPKVTNLTFPLRSNVPVIFQQSLIANTCNPLNYPGKQIRNQNKIRCFMKVRKSKMINKPYIHTVTEKTDNSKTSNSNKATENRENVIFKEACIKENATKRPGKILQ